jgi:hypothetical protein
MAWKERSYWTSGCPVPQEAGGATVGERYERNGDYGERWASGPADGSDLGGHDERYAQLDWAGVESFNDTELKRRPYGARPAHRPGVMLELLHQAVRRGARSLELHARRGRSRSVCRTLWALTCAFGGVTEVIAPDQPRGRWRSRAAARR